MNLVLTDEQKVDLWGLLTQDFKLFAVNKIKDEFGYSHRDSKIIVDHLNIQYGKCNRCDYDSLSEPNMECPKCNAFNYNLNLEPPFNIQFCAELEHKIDFSTFEDKLIKEFWCDGIDHIPQNIKSLTQKYIEQNKKIETKGWFGESGQDIYTLTINFGEMSLKNYKDESSLLNCIPDVTAERWIKIDLVKRKVEIELL